MTTNRELADAWDAGYEEGFWDGGVNAYEHPNDRPNPYRRDA
jgi:hypothetical protein